MADWPEWIGRTRETEDIVTPRLVAGLRATLDSDPSADDATIAPQGIHWLFGQTFAPARTLGADGHPAHGDFLPPIPLPRRMWAMSDVRFRRPIAVGATVTVREAIVSVTPKSGASGELVFVELDRTTSVGGVAAVEERQTIVFREANQAPPRRETDEGRFDFERRCRPDSVMLFRYSALTFNSHRIHYDQAYATGVELYPGLVVHGPLTATLLLDLAARTFGENRLARIAFRAVSPAFADAELRLGGRQTATGADLVAISDDGRVVMRAKAEIG